MAEIAIDHVASYIENLSATNEICVALGTTLTQGTNLFVAVEPTVDASNVISIFPTGGAPPTSDNIKQEPSFLVQIKSTRRATGLKTCQSIINVLSNNDRVIPKGKIFALQSSPIPLGVREGGEDYIVVSNFNAKHVKI